jgi:hypothetical protein
MPEVSYFLLAKVASIGVEVEDPIRLESLSPRAVAPLGHSASSTRAKEVNMKRPLRSRLGVVALGAAALGVVGTVAWATIPDASGEIHACYMKSGGALYVIDDSVTSCKRNATSLDWNVAGPPGPAGPTGPQGPAGATGPAGPAGPANVVVRFVDEMTPDGSNDSATALCEAGEKATGGGVSLISGDSAHTFYFEPGGVPNVNSGTPTGWQASWFQNSGSNETIRVYVVCAS